ncbi:MAG: GNAT family N-acetyltransferase [Bacteroidia bacterium]|jgi:ribosomal protein S18 acetylase RimI-like enzyme|nr:GNAT family N-acetyltransferase [Bacteroidia bacterium]
MLLHVKKANVNDVALLATLGAQTFYDTFHMHHTKADMDMYLQQAYNEAYIAENLANPMVYYAIAYQGEEAVGYTKLKLASSHPMLSGKQVELEKIYVLQTALGSGAGKILMDHIIEIAKQQQCTWMFLGVWEENKRAVAFYQKYGFELFTTRTFQLGTNLCDDFLMKKAL